MSTQSSGHVQAHGVLLALAEHDLAIVLASANVCDVVGVELERVLGAGIASILDEPGEKQLRDLLGRGELACTNPIEARTHDGRCLDAVLHRASGMLVIELEPATRRVHTGRIARAIDRLQSAPDVARTGVEELKDIVGMANVALYRGGELVASCGHAPACVALEPGEVVRFVADRAGAPVALVPAMPLALPDVEIDLRGAVLRATPGEGTGALLALAAGDWGVVVCEDPEPRHVECTARAAAQVFAYAVGMLLACREQLSTLQRAAFDIRLRLRESAIDLEISDSGIGIDPALLPFVSERHGARVTLRLPLAPSRTPSRTIDATPEQAPAAEPEAPLGGLRASVGVLAGAKILVVDDDVDCGDTLALLLQTAGGETEVATTAAAGMAAIHRFHPDVVVSDITLPDKDGFTFMREVRSLGSDDGGWIPAVAVSGHVEPESAREAILAGFQLHIPKPIDPPDLIARLARLVGRTARRT